MTAHRFAVIIGVDGTGVNLALPHLRYAERDATLLRDVLTNPETGTFADDDVRLFIGTHASAARIKSELNRISRDAGPADVLLIYFAGHTLTPAWSLGTDTYLVTPDLDTVTLAADPDAGLRMASLRQDVLEAFPGTALLVLDCCQAGHLPDTADREIDMVTFGGRDKARYCALVARAQDGAAREDVQLGHGILTHHLLEGLRGAAMDDRGRVTFDALGEYVLAQGLDPEPAWISESWHGTTTLARPGGSGTGTGSDGSGTGTGTGGVGGSGTGRRPPDPPDRPETVIELENPLARSAASISRLIAALSRNARPARPDGEPAVSRVEYLKSAVGASSVALLEYTAAGFRTIDMTKRFDPDDLEPLIRAGDTSPFPLDPVWFGHVSRDDGRGVLCVPLSRVTGRALLLALADPSPALIEIGQPLATILRTVWKADFAGAPEEAEIQVLTALKETFGRLPDSLYERCLELYRDVVSSFSIVFQPVITIGKLARNVGVHSYEALARRSPTDQRAPFVMLQIAHAWGDHFVVERDTIILRTALTAYARAHAEGPWDLPKPLSINVAVRSLLSDAYIEDVRAAIAAAGLDPSAVTLEISEQDPIEPRSDEQWPDEPHAHFHKRLATISRDLGVAFAVDDFGVAYATLSRMAELPLTQIKVDRAVLHHPLAESELALVVQTARYASDRGDTHAARVVIVEGVDDESPVSLRQIYDRHIRHVQGYITREPAGPTLRRLTPEACEAIAALARGDNEQRRTVRDKPAPLRKGA